MDPLITNAIDPALLRVLEKRGEARDPARPRKRVPPRVAAIEEESTGDGAAEESVAETPKHRLDDLA
jgi:hypothetical protein